MWRTEKLSPQSIYEQSVLRQVQRVSSDPSHIFCTHLHQAFTLLCRWRTLRPGKCAVTNVLFSFQALTGCAMSYVFYVYCLPTKQLVPRTEFTTNFLQLTIKCILFWRVEMQRIGEDRLVQTDVSWTSTSGFYQRGRTLRCDIINIIIYDQSFNLLLDGVMIPNKQFWYELSMVFF